MSKIGDLRQKLGFNQTQVAAALGLSYQGYYDKEREDTEFKHSELLKIYDLFKERKPDLVIEDIFFK